MKKKNKFFDSAILKEDGSKTTKNSKHFILNNGTRKAVFSSGSMNYFDESEKVWKTIDNSLKKTEDGYLADLGKYTAKISKEKDNETVEVSNGTETISWEYLGIDKNAFSDMGNTAIRSNAKRRSKLNVKTEINDTLNISSASRAIYTDAEGNVDIDYLIEGNGVKENITIKEKSDSYRYYFSLRVAGFEMKTAADGVGIEFYKSLSDPDKTENNAPEFIMPAPFMYDANGARNGNVTYTFEKIEDGMYTFSVEADAEWINSEDRVFPVCIDPQLLTVGDSHITVTHDRYQWCECSDCSCCECDWVHVGNPYYSYIYLHNNGSEKTSAKLKIKKDDIDLTRNTLISAKLIFEQCSGEKYSTAANIMIGNRSYTHNNGEKVTADITDIYNTKSEDFTVDLSMCSAEKTRNFCIPTLEIEYQPIYKAPVRKTLSVENGVSAEFDVLSGNATVTFDDITDTVLGVAVSHVYKPNDNIVEYGQNFRLNLDEKLVKTSTTATGAQYTYTDAHGDVHTFKEHFYRIGSNGEKVYITSEISSITADTDGRLWQGNVEVFRELTTDRGLRASARLEGAVNNAEWIDQRMDEEKQAEEQVKSYKNTLCNFVSVNKKAAVSSVMTEDILSSPDSVESFLSEIGCASHLLLSKEEALSYKSLLTQKESLNASKEALELQKESLTNSAESLLLQHDATDTFDYQKASNDVQLSALQIERDYYNSTPTISINTTNEEEATAPDKEDVTEEVETEEVETEEVEADDVEPEDVPDGEEYESEVSPDYNSLQIGLIGSDGDTLSSNTKIGLVNHHQEVIIPAQKRDWDNQKNHIAAQICNFPGIDAPTSADNGTLTKQYYNTEEQLEVVSEQLADVDSQIKLCREKSTQYAAQFKSYYKEYLNLSNQLETLKEQIPVSYLISDSAVKGFNAKGDLVIVQDKYGKYIVVEREKYTSDGKTRISAVYDKDNRAMTFSYNAGNKLSEICNTLGERVVFRYDGTGYLTKILRDDKPSLTISYSTISGIKRISKIESSNNTYATLSYNLSGMLKEIALKTTVGDISHDNIVLGSETTLSTMAVEYTPELTKLKYDKLNQEIYKIDQTTEQITAYYELVNGFVSNAELYTYDNYLLTKTERADKSCLNRYSYEDFTVQLQIETVENVTYDSFNEPILVEAFKYAIPRTDSDFPIEQTAVEYTYNDNRKLTEKKTTHSYYTDGEVGDTAVAIEKYYYKSTGEIVRTESYVEGEELKTGINIEEHVYNDNGAEIQSFSYNSLDPSSKLYTENEVDKNGKTLATFDESGEHKTAFDYERDGVTVKTERLPNGSKFSYGRDKDGTVTAITHSTENGEENSTTQTRTLDVVTEVKSGNNTVRYAYDGKRRVRSVSLNGIDDYVTYAYSGEHTDAETVTATMADGTMAISTKNAHGNVTKITCGNRTVTNTYNDDQQLTKTVDSVSGTTKLEYDDKGNATSVTAPDHTEAFAYDAQDNTLDSKTITVNGITHTYEYGYKATADKALDSISIDGNVIRPNTDALGRNTGKTIEIGTNKIAEEKISYVKFGDHATSLPSNVRFATNGVFNESIQYRYDSMGNIVEIFENGRSACRYEYDALGRLTREDNVAFGKTTTWAYDNNGNIIARYEYAITTKPTSELHLLDCTYTPYTYADNSDQLMSYGDKAFVYDDIGNPTTYKGKTAVWEYGRQLKSYGGNAFTYDARGRRTGKNNITFTYDSNGNLIKQSNGLEFFYDHMGVFAVKYSGSTYFYRKNAQQDIIALLDNNGKVVVKYKYDAWGNCVIDASTTNTELANLNPFRYRSYYYDTETGFYFLKTRYYDPEIGRFTTIDDLSFLDPESINGLNLYAYCLDNPITYSDPTGHSATLAIILGIVALAGLITTCIGVGTNNNIVTAVGLTMVAVPALISGGMALACFGAWGTMAIGGVTALAGIGTGLFASAEYQEAFTGNNWILATTGMSEGLYNGLMIAIATIATAGTFASMAGVVKYQNFGNSYWDGGWKKMRSHYWKHGLREMKFKNVYDYTHSARNVITNGKYVAQKNAYAMFIGGKKAAFVGVGHGNTLITTYFYRTLTLKKLIEFGLII